MSYLHMSEGELRRHLRFMAVVVEKQKATIMAKNRRIKCLEARNRFLDFITSKQHKIIRGEE